MKSRASLRYRVTLAFALLGFVVSFSLAGALYALTIDMEERLVAETLTAELEDYIGRFQINPEALPPASTTIRTYVIRPGEKSAPNALLELKSGLHQLILDGKDYFAEVSLVKDIHFIVLYDADQIRHRENQFKFFLGIGILVMTIISAFLGYWLAGRVISPVGELAARVADLRPDNNPAPLAEDFSNDEVGVLARNFDAYLKRLAAFLEREQAFTTDISHEFRTPLTVIKGAIEILVEDPGLDNAQRLRVERISRSVNEMIELVSSLLLIAREDGRGESAPDCSVGEALQRVVETNKHLLLKKPVEIKLDIQDQIFLPVECTLLRVVLANLVRNAIYYTEKGQIDIRLDSKGVSVKDTGIGIPKEQLPRVFDRNFIGATGSEGIGLSLVKRICQRYSWSVNIESLEEHGTQVLLAFPTMAMEK